ncbi:MAG: hypothetical protein KDH96_03240 [Candidatus Riesia sp.]|nr:hypothetical protein [Candidatus Riesia sp.]
MLLDVYRVPRRKYDGELHILKFSIPREALLISKVFTKTGYQCKLYHGDLIVEIKTVANPSLSVESIKRVIVSYGIAMDENLEVET